MKNFVLIFVFLLANSFLAYTHHPESDIIDVINYKINLDISDFEGKSISGFTTIEFEPLTEDMSTIYFDLLKLTIDSICSETVEIESYHYNDTLITINMLTSINPGDNSNITVYYHGQPVKDPSGWGGFYFESGYAFNLGVGFEDYPHNYGRAWFPCIDNFTDKATYDITITTQINHKAVCGGKLVSTTIDEENQKAIYEWRLEDPIPTYLASVAVGNFLLEELTYDGMMGEIPIQFYVLPGQSTNVLNSFVNVDTVLSIFESKFGPYRWNRVGYVTVPFVFGAMEHATNVTISSAFLNGGLTYQDLLYHELAHSWFGNLVTCETSGDMWINEGWATYSESIYREFLYGRENMLNYRRGTHNRVLRYHHINEGGFHALYDVPKHLTYSRTVYEKGASVAHSIRGYIGDDELFFDAIAAFMDEFMFDNVNSYQFRDFLSDFTGIDMTDFFDVHVFSGGFVHYSIDSVNILSQENSYDVTVYLKQKLHGRTEFANSNRIEISFMDQDLNLTTKMIEFDGEYGEQTFTLPFEPMLVISDFYEKFSDATNKKSELISETGTYFFSEIYFRANVDSVDENQPAFLLVSHNFVAPDKFKEEIPGLVIANHRYWTIQGNFPEGFAASGGFNYRRNSVGPDIFGYLDNFFINNSNDSLRLVYRPDRASDWKIVEDQTNQWSLSFGRITVENLMQGEYALAIFDWEEYSSSDITFSVKNIENNLPIENATVTIEEEGDYQTGPNGKVSVKLKNGTYGYTVTVDGYETYEASFTVADEDKLIEILITSEENLIGCNAKDDFYIFPNPGYEIITIYFDIEFSGNIYVYNSLGRIVMQKNVAEMTLSTVINFNDMPEGVYIIELHGNNNYNRNKKIIIEK